MINNFTEFIQEINEMTSATGGPSVGGGMGYGSAASGLAGQTIGTNWASSKSAEPDELAIPYNPSGSNRVFQKIPIRKSRNHGSNRDKKIKSFKDILFKRRQDYTKGEGDVKEPKVMSYDNFAKDDIINIKKHEGIGTTIGALGLAASSILHPSKPKEILPKDPVKDTTILQKPTSDKEKDLSLFIDTIVEKYPDVVEKKTLPISVLESELRSFNINSNSKILKFGDYTVPKLSLKDLDLLSTDLFNFKVNYFYIRGLDTYDVPVLIPILNLSYTNIVKIHGHDVEFNFTRMTGVNAVGTKINF